MSAERPDVLCLQEIKISDDARAKEAFNFSDYREFWHSAKRPGYAGTLTLVKDKYFFPAREGTKFNNSPSLQKKTKFFSTQGETKFDNFPPARGRIKGGGRENINNFVGLIKFPRDNEGRAQILEFNKFYLANVYFPNANHELSRLDFKMRFNNRLLNFLKKFKKKKPFIVAGDYNVAREEIDLARPKSNRGNAGFTDRERVWMTKFLNKGFVDTFRRLNPEKIQYSWWSYKFNARVRNIGWRVDYFCVSDKLFPRVKSSFIYNQIKGSDHCPVGIILDNNI